MKPLATMEVHKAERETKEMISYYILEEEKYGLKIVKNFGSEKAREEEAIIHNISSEKEVVENVINTIIENSNDISQMAYFIEDLLNQNKQAIQIESKTQSLV